MGSPPRILIVDDEPTLLRLGHFILSRHGYEVVIVEDSRMALRLLKDEGPFDLVMTDWLMPYVKGIEIVRAIRAGEVSVANTGTPKDVRIIFSSMRSDEEFVAKAFAAGCDQFLSKPYSPEYLIKLVKKCLDENLTP